MLFGNCPDAIHVEGDDSHFAFVLFLDGFNFLCGISRMAALASISEENESKENSIVPPKEEIQSIENNLKILLFSIDQVYYNIHRPRNITKNEINSQMQILISKLDQINKFISELISYKQYYTDKKSFKKIDDNLLGNYRDILSRLRILVKLNSIKRYFTNYSEVFAKYIDVLNKYKKIHNSQKGGKRRQTKRSKRTRRTRRK